MSSNRLKELKLQDKQLGDEIRKVKNVEQLDALVNQYVTNNPFVEPNGRAAVDKFKKETNARLTEENNATRYKIPGLFTKRHEIQDEMTKMLVEESISDLENYLKNRNATYQATDSIKRAGSNVLKLIGRNVDPDYRLRREFIGQLITELKALSCDKFDYKAKLIAKLKEGETFKSSNSEQSLEVVLERIAERFEEVVLERIVEQYEIISQKKKI